MKVMKALAAMAALMAIAGGPERKRNVSMPIGLQGPLPSSTPRPKGLKIFNIDGVDVWAINEKNAIRKANKTIG